MAAPHAIAQLEVAGDEVRVEVGEEDVRDREAMLVGEREVLPDVALRVDDRGRAAICSSPIRYEACARQLR